MLRFKEHRFKMRSVKLVLLVLVPWLCLEHVHAWSSTFSQHALFSPLRLRVQGCRLARQNRGVWMKCDDGFQPVVYGRRALLCALSSLMIADTVLADERTEATGEGIRKMAAKIPGLGPPDVYYPKDFEGRWKVQRLTAGVDFPLGVGAVGPDEATKLKQREGVNEAFEWRYVRNQENIVADREFNSKQLIKAEEGKDAGVVWVMTNPNVLSISYPDGRIRESKVTKRATTLGEDGTTLESSEFRREANLGFSGSVTGVLGVPDISASWVRSRYKVVANNKIDGIVIEYRLPKGQQDPQKAVVKLKYRLSLERISSQEQ